MKQTALRIVTAVMIALVVNFVAANTVAMHTHQLADGSTLVHSHPYYPAAGHTHSGAAVDSISAMNVAATSFIESVAVALTPCIDTLTYIDDILTVDIRCCHAWHNVGRAPPMCD